MSLHARVQIEYLREDKFVGRLDGFDPTSDRDRLVLHAVLDEFLDEYLVPEFRVGDLGNPMCHFTVSGNLHDDSNLAF